VGKDIEIKDKKDFSYSNDEELEHEVIMYALKNGYEVVTICTRKIYFKLKLGYSDEEIDNQLNENKSKLKPDGKPNYARCTVIKITRK
jgi:hypothetical protein